MEEVQSASMSSSKQEETLGESGNMLQRLHLVLLPACKCCWTLQLICRQVSDSTSIDHLLVNRMNLICMADCLQERPAASWGKNKRIKDQQLEEDLEQQQLLSPHVVNEMIFCCLLCYCLRNSILQIVQFICLV